MVQNLTHLLSSVVKRGRTERQPTAPRETCLVCDANLVGSRLHARYKVCPNCRFHYSITARERLDSLIDPNSFQEINRSITSLDPLSFSSRPSYKERLFHEQRRTGLTEAVVTGIATIGGSAAVLIILDFGFMGGTMGCVVGEKVALALEEAAKRKLPVFAVVTSGGARIQEGVLSLMQMAKISVAANSLNDKGLPFVSVLANPSTGQAYAIFANLADIVIAEPGAIMGFSPLRAMRETSDQPLPSGSHTAEAHLDHGMLDAVVDRTQIRDVISVLLDLLGPQYRLKSHQKDHRPEPEVRIPQAWSSVQLARHKDRPSSLDYIGRIFPSFVELHGDRSFGDDKAIVCGMGQLGGQTIMVIGQERGRGLRVDECNDGRTSPEGFGKAQRTIDLASKFDIPLITLIDTPGPNLSLEAEERGLGTAIAATMSKMARLQVPSISVVIGEGGSAGALSLGIADRVLMMENAIYTTISPEDAARLMFRDADRASEVAGALRLTAQDCLDLNIVDVIVPEPPGGAHTNPDEASRQLRRIFLQQLVALQSTSKRRMLRSRHKRFRNMGEYSSHFKMAIAKEVHTLQALMATGVRRVGRRSLAKTEDLPEDAASHKEHTPSTDSLS